MLLKTQAGFGGFIFLVGLGVVVVVRLVLFWGRFSALFLVWWVFWVFFFVWFGLGVFYLMKGT